MVPPVYLMFRGPRIIAVAGNLGHLWGEQHRIETRTKPNHSWVNSGRLTIGGNYSRSPLDRNKFDTLSGRIAIAKPTHLFSSRQQTARLSECPRWVVQTRTRHARIAPRPPQRATSRLLRCTLHFRNGSSTSFQAQAAHFRLSPGSGNVACVAPLGRQRSRRMAANFAKLPEMLRRQD